MMMHGLVALLLRSLCLLWLFLAVAVFAETTTPTCYLSTGQFKRTFPSSGRGTKAVNNVCFQKSPRTSPILLPLRLKRTNPSTFTPKLRNWGLSVSVTESSLAVTDNITLASQPLLDLVSEHPIYSNDSSQQNDLREDQIRMEIDSLESSFSASFNRSTTSNDEDPQRFNPLIGLYQVQYVLSAASNKKLKKKNNPVGGKWTRDNGLAQRIFQTRNTFQHLLPYNATSLARKAGAVAEAINVVSLDAFGGLLRATVILRGDVVPITLEERSQMSSNETIARKWDLNNDAENSVNATERKILSNLAVRALFDPPYIFFGKRRRQSEPVHYTYFPLQIGPSSSVVLDTTYYDKVSSNKEQRGIRIGMGGTSGTRFVFARCGEYCNEQAGDYEDSVTQSTENEANEYQLLLSQPPVNKLKVMSAMGGLLAFSMSMTFGVIKLDIIKNILGGVLSRASPLFGSNRRSGFICSTIFDSRLFAGVTQWLRIVKPWALAGIRTMAGVVSLLVGISMMAILFSRGGIERDGT